MLWVPLNEPPAVAEVVAVHDVALVDVHFSCTACPKLIVDGCVGAEKDAVGMAGGGGGGGIIGAL